MPKVQCHLALGADKVARKATRFDSVQFKVNSTLFSNSLSAAVINHWHIMWIC